MSVPPRFLRRDWDDGSVLFDPATGDTHALNPLCALVLEIGAEEARALADTTALQAELKRATRTLARLGLL